MILLDTASIAAFVDWAYAMLLALILAVARIAAVLQIFPLFTVPNIRGQIRTVLALALAVPIVPVLQAEVRPLLEGPLLVILVLVMKEFLFGIVLGALLAIPFWGIQSAGDLIDSNRGASAANQSDPVNANEQSQLGTIFNFAAIAVFVVMGGLQILVGLLYDSFLVVRVSNFLPNPGDELVKTLGLMMNKMFIIGIVVGGPILIALAVIDVSLVFASRIAKQIQANEFSSVAKNLCTAAFVPMYAIFLSQYMIKDWSSMMMVIRDFIGIRVGG